MMISYDNIDNATNLITFTDIPNILKVYDDDEGSYARLTLTFQGNITNTSAGVTPYIKILGEMITGTRDYREAVNKNFFMSTSSISTAASVARALRNCPGIIAAFTVNNVDNRVELVSRAWGSVFAGSQDYYQTNISSQYLSYSVTDGSASELNGALITVDVFSNGNYITTLEKSFYGTECAFNMSPVLTTIAQHGRATEYDMSVSYTKNGEYYRLIDYDNNHIVVGYMVNQGEKYLDAEEFTYAANVSRGRTKGTFNNTVLYLYGNKIEMSFFNGNIGGMDFTITYRDSALNEITATTQPWRNSDSSRKLWDVEIPLQAQYMTGAFYVDITMYGMVMRFNVIRPVKAAEYYQRIYWRNSYGGISFFDFTGGKTETRDVEISTYQKSIFDYYTSYMNELDKVYDNNVKYTVTLKSHLIENDAKYVFNDLLQSTETWTEVNGENYAIIIDNVSVEETDQNNIYQATVRYKYSMEPSLI